MFRNNIVKELSDILEKEGNKIDKEKLEEELHQVAKKNWHEIYTIHRKAQHGFLRVAPFTMGGCALSMYGVHEGNVPMAATAVGLALIGVIYNVYVQRTLKKEERQLYSDNSNYVKKLLSGFE